MSKALLADKRFAQAEPLFEPYQVVCDEGSLVAIHKPPGLPSTGMKMHDPYCLQHILLTDFREMLWAVHQLDMDTSGLILFVREKSAVQFWKRRMSHPDCHKVYWAICHGNPEFSKKRVEAPIGETSDHFQWGVTEQGKEAITEIEVMEQVEGFALVKVKIITGRTHQIRVHMRYLGFPLVGEQWYLEPPCTRFHRQALHAHAICFADEYKPSVLSTPLHKDLRLLAEALGFRQAEWSF